MKIRFLPLILLCLLLGGCSRAVAGGHLISAAEGSEEYCTVLNTFLPGYIPREPEDTLYAEVSRGNAVACFDVQAVPAMRRGVGRYWYPHVLGTVVLAVDRTRTDEVITGWGSLLHSRTPVGMSSFSVIRNMLAMGALSYGLNQKEPAKQDALDFLEHLNRNGGFELDGSDAPILICLDYEVAEWNRNGENYEIIVPEEGTLSFRLGLLSDSPLALEPGLDEALLSAGLPPASGERPQGFPGDYSAAHTLSEEDYDWFLELAGDSSRDLRRQVSGACRRQQQRPAPAGFPHPPLYYGRPQRAHSLRPAHFRRDIAVERDGVTQNDPPGCPPCSGGYGLADGGMAAAAPVQISAAAGWNPVPDVLVWLLYLPAGSACRAALSD